MSDVPVPATVDAKPKAYTVGRVAGGELPDVGKILQETFAEFGDNLAPYALAGVGHFLVQMPVIFVSVFLVYLVVFGGMFGTMMVGSVLSAIVADAVSEDLGAIGFLLTSALSMIVPIVLALGLVGLIGAAMAPLHASLIRAVARHQRGEEPLSLGSAFTSAHDHLVHVILVAFATTFLALALLSLCYVPVLAMPIVFPFAATLVALHRRGAMDGLRTAFSHSTANLNWYLMFGLLTFAGGMVAGYVPVLGMMFMTAFHVRAYRYVFGDGPDPVLART